jgi:hypothetical protein
MSNELRALLFIATSKEDFSYDGEVISRDCIDYGKHKKERKKENTKKVRYVRGPQVGEDKHDVETENENDACIVCMSRKKTCVNSPCAHVCLCIACARTVAYGEPKEPRKRGTVHCPMCKVALKSIKRIFL